MATLNDTGYQSGTWVDELPAFVYLMAHYKCKLCGEAFRKPVQAPCGHRFCQFCLERLFCDTPEGFNIKCPTNDGDCEKFAQKQINPDYCIQKELQQQKVYCPNMEYGCNSVVKWGRIQEHLKLCKYGSGQCPYRELGCHETVPKHELKKHSELCEFIPVPCDVCQENVPYCKLKEHKCKTVTATSPNQSPFQSTREKMSEQTTTSSPNPNEGRDQSNIVSTETSSVEPRPVSHVETPGGHLVQPSSEETSTNREEETMASNMTQDDLPAEHDYNKPQVLEQRMAGVERSLAAHDSQLAENDVRMLCLENTSYNGTLVWKITDYQRRKQDAVTLSVNSYPFYTSRTGYKMCARVYLNGDGDSQGTHLSMYLVIMKGEHDNVLSWPFKQKVKFSLLAQSGENGDEHGRPIKGRLVPSNHGNHGNHEGFRQPVNEMNVAMGCPKFCRITEIEKHPYLIGDTIFVKVAVKTKGLDP